MPNWYDVSYKLEGSKETLEKIHRVVEEFKKEKRKPVVETASQNWEGNILGAFGLDPGGRGFIEDCYFDSDEHNVLTINAFEAWCRTQFAEKLMEKFEDLSVFWIGEEPGCGIYETNDAEGKYFPDRIKVEGYIDGEDFGDYFTNDLEAWEYAMRKSNGKVNGKTSLVRFNDENADTDNYISVCEYDVVG